MAIPTTLGERMAAALAGAGLTRSRAAELLGLNRQTVGRWVAGEEVTEAQLARVAELTGRSAAWLRYGLVDGSEVAVERYLTGYEDAKADMQKILEHLQPAPREALKTPDGETWSPTQRPQTKTPVSTREVEPATEPFGSGRKSSKKKA